MFVGSAPALGTNGTTHSQNNQDWFVSTLLSCKRGGYFVDLAANDAMLLSNTLMLERDYGWQGLCIEPNMGYYYGLARRKCALVAAAIGSPTDSAVTFNMEGALGGIVGFDQKENNTHAQELRTVALGELLERLHAPATIDYMSLDVEGAESLVMDGFPWGKFKFSVLSVERPKADLRSTLVRHGYTNMNITCAWDDEIWIHSSLPGHAGMRARWAGADAMGDFDESGSCMHAAGYRRAHVRPRPGADSGESPAGP